MGDTDTAEAGTTDNLQQDIYHEDPDAAERTETKKDGSADADSAEESAADMQDESSADDTEQTTAAGSSSADTEQTTAAGSSAADTQAAGSKQITVSSGDGSDTVAKKLYEVGLVSDAAAYDRYLCQNGYDKKICTGVKTIPAGATEAEIAQILTTR